MPVFKCKKCGGTIEFEQSATVCVCDSCGTRQTLPCLDDEKKTNLYDQANQFRQNNDSDKAMGIYEQIYEAETHAEEKRIADEKAAKKRKKIIAVTIPVVCACIAFIILLNPVIIPTIKYNSAISLYNAGKYTEAISAFDALNGYKDITTQIEKCNTAIKDEKYDEAVALYNDKKYTEAISAFEALDGYKDSTEKIQEIKSSSGYMKVAKVGDIILFGSYEQDNNTSNGKEDIEWRVLAKKDNKILLISEYALDFQQYTTSYTSVTWENCSLRKWLNDTFLNAVFSAAEQKMILITNVSADKNPEYSTDPGNATLDKVFLLSIAEVEKYFSSDEDRKCIPTAYAEAQGAYVSTKNAIGGKATCEWWLRSPSYDQDFAATVNVSGSLSFYYDYINDVTACVRPALWIILEP